MGFWHDHGAVDFSVRSVCGRHSDVAGAGEEELPVRLANAQYRLKAQTHDRRVDRRERLFYTEIKNKCSACFAVRKE